MHHALSAHTPDSTPPSSLWSEFDLYLFGQGEYYRIYEKMGAHVCSFDDITGVNFSLWAPHAARVSVIGDFNNWQADTHPMHLRHTGLGLWECFVPHLTPGSLYKFEIHSQLNDYTVQKADPYAFSSELRPSTASRIVSQDNYLWHDSSWLSQRAQSDSLHEPISIYEVHLGSWRHDPARHQPGAAEEDRFLTYRELAVQLADYVKELGFTHIELLPMTEFPFDGSWGYQVGGYYAPTSRFGTPDDFRFFVDYLHQQGIGVILDWVPSHFPKDGYALSFFDGTHLYEYEDPRKGEHLEWGTYVFDYGRPEVRNFLIGSALFWLREYHLDGLRVDAVASMLYLDYMRPTGTWVTNQYGGREHLEAVQFLQQLNKAIYAEVPGTITIAEESTAWPLVTKPTYVGGLGFTFKWNMGWMHDMLTYMHTDSIHRRYHQNNITFSLVYAFSENFILPLSHDEVVHLKGSLLTKMPGDLWQRFANLRAFYGYMWGHPGKKLLFMGGEFGQWTEWNYKESIDWHLLTPPSDPHHKQLQTFVSALNRLYQQEPALSQNDYDASGFFWIDCNDVENSIISFVRCAQDTTDFLLFACNFTPVPRQNYRLGAPRAGVYEEILNSDSVQFGGSGFHEGQSLTSEPIPWHGQDHSLLLTFPPMSTIILKIQA